MNLEMDNQSIISDITDLVDNNTVSSQELHLKIDDINKILEQKLNETTMDNLKEKCKCFGINGISKLKKQEIIKLLLSEFVKIFPILNDKKKNELKSICTMFNIKFNIGIKKDELSLCILQYCANNLIFKIDEPFITKPAILIKPDDLPSSKLSLIEELEQQKREIELKMQEETLRQQKLEEETQRIKLEEEQKRIEEEKKKEKEESKKKKQSIPKNVRNIIWNHYIGEDIIKHKCLCCKKVTITNTNFDVGHVLSEKNGGTHEINNLRPICFACNHSMGTENMIDFVVKYGLYIG